MKYLMVWAVIALWAVAAGTCPADGDRWVVVNGPYGPMRVLERDVPVTWRNTPVTVDGEYALEHPEQRGLQAVVASNRKVLRDHEGRLQNLEFGQSYPQTTPTQSLGGDYTPATVPAQGVSNMDPQTIQVVQGVTAGQLAGAFIALGVVGVLVWIAVVVGRRTGDEGFGLGTLTQALTFADGEVRGSATAPDGRSVAFRAAGINQQAQAAAIANAQGGAATPAAPAVAAPPVAPPPAAPPAPPAQRPGTPAQRAMVRAMLGNAQKAQTDDNIDIVILAAPGTTPPTDLYNAQAVNGLVTSLLAVLA